MEPFPMEKNKSNRNRHTGKIYRILWVLKIIEYAPTSHNRTVSASPPTGKYFNKV
jgi:hypothetical protein